MEEVIQLVQSELEVNNGDILYSDFLEKVSFPLRQYIPRAMREMKSRGIATRQNVLNADDGSVTLHIKAL